MSACPQNATFDLLIRALLVAVLTTAPQVLANESITPLVDYQIVDNGIPQALTATPGNSTRGLSVFLDRTRGHCLLCHRVTSIAESSQGNIGPSLDNVGDRLTTASLRLRVVDGTTVNADTAMPAYYRIEKLHQVSRNYQNQPVLSAQEVEDVVAWLDTLRAPNAN